MVFDETDMYPKAKLEWSEGSGCDDRPFMVRTEVNGKSLLGKGWGKKQAKLSMACTYGCADLLLYGDPRGLQKPIQFAQNFATTLS